MERADNGHSRRRSAKGVVVADLAGEIEIGLGSNRVLQEIAARAGTDRSAADHSVMWAGDQ
jgi:hypothetical protein